MRRQVLPAIRYPRRDHGASLGLVYPTGRDSASASGLFDDQANGSLVKRNGQVVGSSLIGQNFAKPKYFHPRPSAAGTDGYDGTASAGSNLGPTNTELIKAVEERAAAYRKENRLSPNTKVPVDAVTASGSGLDPHISVANARLQTPRVAKARGHRRTRRCSPRRRTHDDPHTWGPRREDRQRARAQSGPRRRPMTRHAFRRLMRMSRGHASHLPRRSARRRQDVRDAQRGLPASRQRGTDVVVGFVETHGRSTTAGAGSATSRSYLGSA